MKMVIIDDSMFFIRGQNFYPKNNSFNNVRFHSVAKTE